MDWLLGIIGVAVVIGFPWWLLHGATSNRMRDKEQELDEWSGVLDVKRNTRDKLDSDPEYVNRVQDKFND